MIFSPRFRTFWIVVGGVAFFLFSSVMVAPLSGRYKTAKTVKALAAIKDVGMGIKNYQVEYNRCPVLKGSAKASEDLRLETQGEWLDLLLGTNVQGQNPRGIVFLEPTMSRNGKGGLIERSPTAGPSLVDSWGLPFVVLVEANQDGKIANPDLKNTSDLVRDGAPPVLNAGVVGYSFGPDGIEGTHDDIVSWRDPIPPHSEKFYRALEDAGAVVLLLLALNGFIQMLLKLWELVRPKQGTPQP